MLKFSSRKSSLCARHPRFNPHYLHEGLKQPPSKTWARSCQWTRWTKSKKRLSWVQGWDVLRRNQSEASGKVLSGHPRQCSLKLVQDMFAASIEAGSLACDRTSTAWEPLKSAFIASSPLLGLNSQHNQQVPLTSCTISVNHQALGRGQTGFSLYHKKPRWGNKRWTLPSCVKVVRSAAWGLTHAAYTQCSDLPCLSTPSHKIPTFSSISRQIPGFF